MPLTLANGEVIYNVTSHDLSVWDDNERRMYWVQSDGVVNARTDSELLEKHNNFIVVRMSYKPTVEGRLLIERIKRECPKALILGSVIAAQAYPGEVFAPTPVKYDRLNPNKRYNAVHSNRFSSFHTPKETQNG